MAIFPTRINGQFSADSIQVGVRDTTSLSRGTLSCVNLEADTLTVNDLTITNNLSVDHNITAGGTLGVTGNVSMGADASVSGNLNVGSITAGPDISFAITPSMWAGLTTAAGGTGYQIKEMPTPNHCPIVYLVTAVYTGSNGTNFTVPVDTKLWIGISGKVPSPINAWVGSGIPLNGFVDVSGIGSHYNYSYFMPNPDLLDDDQNPLTEAPINNNEIIAPASGNYAALYIITDNETALSGGTGTLTINIWYNLCYTPTTY